MRVWLIYTKRDDILGKLLFYTGHQSIIADAD